ncbi:hypothetical protein H9L39_14583 [Fusarium oxysporum f. sp. albedinis]|nr:hypothetical protein H9L39_14583 [Fusarium oxysporum f. sp. albedinis]
MLDGFLRVAITKTLGPRKAMDLPSGLTHTVRTSSLKDSDWALNLSKRNIEVAKLPSKLVDVRKLLGVEKTSTPGGMEIGRHDPPGSLNKYEN